MSTFNKVNFIKTENIVFEKNAYEQLNSMLLLTNTIESIKNVDLDYFGDSDSDILEVSITPDFHKGSTVPIGTTMLTQGFILPQAIGSDINCGMRLYTTDIDSEKIMEHLGVLESKIRHVFFEGGRHIPMNNIQREALLKEGAIGILETANESNGIGLWQYYDSVQEEKDLNNICDNGSYITNKVIGLDDFLGTNQLSYDTQIGTIGGGNHFMEVQRVAKIFDAKTASAWGLKNNQTVIMIHTGSLMIGQSCGSLSLDILKRIYPKGIRQPQNGIYPLPKSDKFNSAWEDFWTLMYNAANFAFCNRLFLGLMIKKIFIETFGECNFTLLYDAPHNLVWKENIDNKEVFLHRKGACPARSMEQMVNTNFAYYGEPVFVPGSMGASSFILAGLGNRDSLFSSSHGAGRKLSRSKAIQEDHKKFLEFIKNFHVITPINPNRPDIVGRDDILKKWQENIKSEAPYAYKEINEIIKVQSELNITKMVAEVHPLFTIKN